MDSDQQGLTIGAVAKAAGVNDGDGALLPAPRAVAEPDKTLRPHSGATRRRREHGCGS